MKEGSVSDETVQALRERCSELEKEKLELGCREKAQESEASR